MTAISPKRAVRLVPLALVAAAIGLPVPAFAQNPTGTVAYSTGDGLYTLSLGGSPTLLASGSQGDFQAPSWAPNGNQIAFSDQSPSGPNPSSYRRTFPTINVKAATGSSPGKRLATRGTDPVFSPSGKQVAYTGVTNSQGVFVVPAGGGKARRLTPKNGPLVSSVAWMPTGNTLIYIVSPTNGTPQLRTISASGGASSPVPLALPAGTTISDSATWASVDTSSTSVAVSVETPLQPPGVAIVPLSGGAPTTIVSGIANGWFSPDGSMLCGTGAGDGTAMQIMSVATGVSLLNTGITAAISCSWQP